MLLFVALAIILRMAHGSPSPLYILADIHYDPYFGSSDAVGTPCQTSAAPRFGEVGCDTSPALLSSAVEDFASEYSMNNGSVILYLGDVVRHKMKIFEDSSASSSSSAYGPDYEIVYNITRTVFDMLQKSLSKKHLFYHPGFITQLGNEDCTPDYHFINSNEPSLHPGLLRHTEALVQTGILTKEDGDFFRRCAFYSRVIPGTNLFVIALNTIIYSVDQRPSGQSAKDPCGQLEWLTQQLHEARRSGYRVMITGHVVPYPQKWVATLLDQYRTIVMDFEDVISAQWFAHTHMFAFQTLSRHKAPLLFDVPAITPRDGNQPSYIAVTIKDQPSVNASRNTSTWEVENIRERFLDYTSPSPAWRNGKSFPADFDISTPLSTSALYDYGVSLLEESRHDSEWETFEAFHFGGVTLTPLHKKDKAKLLCDMLTASDDDYRSCRSQYGALASESN